MTIERALPSGVDREINREDSQEIYLVFLTIMHENLPVPIRIVSDPKDFTLDGEVHQGFQFNISMLTDDNQAPFAQLDVQNVDQKIGNVLLNIQDPPKLKMEIIAGSEFDLTADPRTELSAPSSRVYTAEELYLRDVEVTTISVTGRLSTWDYSQEIWPGVLATQNRFPGLFR